MLVNSKANKVQALLSALVISSGLSVREAVGSYYSHVRVAQVASRHLTGAVNQQGA